jgi:uncharacterized membrane protein YdbT with pleckstrin-like domain
MGYVRDNLMQGERLVFQTKLHWVVYGPPSVFAAASVAVGVAIGSQHGAIVAVSGLSIALLSAAIRWIRRQTWEFAVTNRRVLVKTGLVARRTRELQVDRIESLSIDQPVLGRLLGYGTVSVRGTGAGRRAFPSVARAMELRRHVYEQAERREQQSRRDPKPHSAGVVRAPTERGDKAERFGGRR